MRDLSLYLKSNKIVTRGQLLDIVKAASAKGAWQREQDILSARIYEAKQREFEEAASAKGAWQREQDILRRYEK